MPPTRSTRSRSAGILAVALAVVLAAWALQGPASAAPRQEDTTVTSTSDTTITTTEDLLEDQTTVPPTTEEAPSTTMPGAADEDSPADDETRTVWLIVAGLVLVAILLGLLTFRYWQRTRPMAAAAPPTDGDGDADADADAADGPDAKDDRPRRERRTVG